MDGGAGRADATYRHVTIILQQWSKTIIEVPALPDFSIAAVMSQLMDFILLC